ncbi:trigger factor-like, partial [Morone saxatilis]|uniref:trigger factor-like n=1 Tax=Morone saxatilis TaxID=34816 RepID=UPI0015E1CB12
MTAEDLLNTLEDLKDEEFKNFKWYLKQPDILEGYKPIKESKLEKAKERQDTVDLMVKTFNLDGALKVTKKVLEKIKRNDLVQSLPDTSSDDEDNDEDGDEDGDDNDEDDEENDGDDDVEDEDDGDGDDG